MKTKRKVVDWAKLDPMAQRGFNSYQIAEKLGVGTAHVKKKAKALGVVVAADAIMGRSKIVRHQRVLEATVQGLEAMLPDFESIDPAQVEPGVLKQSIDELVAVQKSLSRFVRKLRRETR